MSRRILIVEDEPDLARLLAIHLADAGCETDHAPNAALALAAATNRSYDLIVLDLGLPDGDGLDICRQLRADEDYTPVLILTARSSETDRVVGLELGADDYLTKPFSVRELVARVKAILRRIERLAASSAEGDDDPAPLAIGDLVIDRRSRRISVGDQPVHLTAKEFDLLALFAANPGRVYTRAQLLDLVWGYDTSSYEHTVNSHINRLRAKIEQDPSSPRYIQTVWGVGYRFYEPPARGTG